MKKIILLVTGLFVFTACKTSEEKQEISPISLSKDLKATVVLKSGEKLTITNQLENIKVADIEKVTLLNSDATWVVSYKDSTHQYGDIKLRNKSASSLDRNKTLIVIDGVKKSKEFDLDSIKPDHIKSIQIFKGASVKEKFNTTEFESVIEIFTK